ncbi:unnamed protein product [Meganyctiphanes norvegica]|uniref:Globin domain-containing protein n=1 Tax=Meganyctiphanes norvegica TaxID=48144 RepID=A0AAV2RXH7_MEGNR
MGGVLTSVWRWWSGDQLALCPNLGPEADVPDPTTGLTPRDKASIVATWDLVRPNLKQHGINFFMKLFEEEPDLQQRFASFRDKDLSELRTNKRMAAHATTVMTAIQACVDNLDDVETLVELLKTTGVNHEKRGIPKEDFELLAPVLIDFLGENLGNAWTPQAKAAWTQAMKVINAVITSQYKDD